MLQCPEQTNGQKECSGEHSFRLGLPEVSCQWCGKPNLPTLCTSNDVVYYEDHQLQKKNLWFVLKIDSILAVFSENVRIHLELVSQNLLGILTYICNVLPVLW